jgi:hypothetical protein
LLPDINTFPWYKIITLKTDKNNARSTFCVAICFLFLIAHFSEIVILQENCRNEGLFRVNLNQPTRFKQKNNAMSSQETKMLLDFTLPVSPIAESFNQREVSSGLDPPHFKGKPFSNQGTMHWKWLKKNSLLHNLTAALPPNLNHPTHGHF